MTPDVAYIDQRTSGTPLAIDAQVLNVEEDAGMRFAVYGRDQVALEAIARSLRDQGIAPARNPTLAREVAAAADAWWLSPVPRQDDTRAGLRLSSVAPTWGALAWPAASGTLAQALATARRDPLTGTLERIFYLRRPAQIMSRIEPLTWAAAPATLRGAVRLVPWFQVGLSR